MNKAGRDDTTGVIWHCGREFLHVDDHTKIFNQQIRSKKKNVLAMGGGGEGEKVKL